MQFYSKNFLTLIVFLIFLTNQITGLANNFTVVVRSKATEKGAQSSLKEFSKYEFEFQFKSFKMFTKYGIRYRICAGDYSSLSSADSARKIVAEKTGIKDCWVMNQSDYFNIDKFIEAYADFSHSFAIKDFQNIEKYVHPEMQIALNYGEKLENSVNFNDFTALLDTVSIQFAIGRMFIERDFEFYCTSIPQVIELPKYNCDSSKYINNIYSMQQVKVSKSKKEKAEFDINNKIKIVNSEATIFYALEFSLIGKRWYLSAVNISPDCQK